MATVAWSGSNTIDHVTTQIELISGEFIDPGPTILQTDDGGTVGLSTPSATLIVNNITLPVGTVRWRGTVTNLGSADSSVSIRLVSRTSPASGVFTGLTVLTAVPGGTSVQIASSVSNLALFYCLEATNTTGGTATIHGLTDALALTIPRIYFSDDPIPDGYGALNLVGTATVTAWTGEASLEGSDDFFTGGLGFNSWSVATPGQEHVITSAVLTGGAQRLQVTCSNIAANSVFDWSVWGTPEDHYNADTGQAADRVEVLNVPPGDYVIQNISTNPVTGVITTTNTQVAALLIVAAYKDGVSADFQTFGLNFGDGTNLDFGLTNLESGGSPTGKAITVFTAGTSSTKGPRTSNVDMTDIRLNQGFSITLNTTSNQIHPPGAQPFGDCDPEIVLVGAMLLTYTPAAFPTPTTSGGVNATIFGSNSGQVIWASTLSNRPTIALFGWGWTSRFLLVEDVTAPTWDDAVLAPNWTTVVSEKTTDGRGFGNAAISIAFYDPKKSGDGFSVSNLNFWQLGFSPGAGQQGAFVLVEGTNRQNIRSQILN